VDDRDRFGSPGYSGHKIYYREGAGSFRLDAMQQVSPRELRRLISGSKKSAKGGAGSGNHGHAGRPGEVGGSAPGLPHAKAINDAILEMQERQKNPAEHHIGIDLATGERVCDVIGDAGGSTCARDGRDVVNTVPVG
jgi:hypothetical protein